VLKTVKIAISIPKDPECFT